MPYDVQERDWLRLVFVSPLIAARRGIVIVNGFQAVHILLCVMTIRHRLSNSLALAGCWSGGMGGWLTGNCNSVVVEVAWRGTNSCCRGARAQVSPASC